MPDQRALLRGRLASVIDSVADVAAQLDPPAAGPMAPPPPPAPPGRPWTVAAAMEPIATVVERPMGTTSALPPLQPPDLAPPMEPPAYHRVGAVILGSVLIAMIVILVLALHPFQATAPPAATTVAGQIALTAVRPVASSAPAGGSLPPTQVSFPPGTSTVSIDVNSGTTAGQSPVEIVVSGGEPPVSVIDHDYVLDSSGDTLIPLTPESGSFAPGDYTVLISSNGAALGSTAFEVR